MAEAVIDGVCVHGSRVRTDLVLDSIHKLHGSQLYLLFQAADFALTAGLPFRSVFFHGAYL